MNEFQIYHILNLFIAIISSWSMTIFFQKTYNTKQLNLRDISFTKTETLVCQISMIIMILNGIISDQIVSHYLKNVILK